MDAYRILHYQTAAEKCPYEEWLESLKDRRGLNLIQQRVRRIRAGHFGDCRALSGGVWEMRIHFGPGYRVYYVKDRADVVILLCGGDKGSQRRDIETSLLYADDYWRRTL